MENYYLVILLRAYLAIPKTNRKVREYASWRFDLLVRICSDTHGLMRKHKGTHKPKQLKALMRLQYFI